MRMERLLVSHHAQGRLSERDVPLTPAGQPVDLNDAELQRFLGNLEKITPGFAESVPVRFSFRGYVYVVAREKGELVLVTAFPLSNERSKVRR